MLSPEEAAFVANVREPLLRNLMEAIRQEYSGLGWPIVVLTLVELLGTTMEGVLTLEPTHKRQFVDQLDALKLHIETLGEREH